MLFHIFNWGFGVESTAQLMRWILFPDTRPFKSWKEVVIISAQTGDEFWETKHLCETFIFPLLRKIGVRFIEIGKAGASQKDGYVILQDTTEPYVLHIRDSRIHTLGDNMEMDGWVPRLNRPHLCAQKWKGVILDQLIGDFLRSMRGAMAALAMLLLTRRQEFATSFLLPYVRFLFEEPLIIGPYLGYNRDEIKRMKDSLDYGCHGASFRYPLIEDDWSRNDCIELLYLCFRVVWHKSACDHCPFQDKKNRRQHYAADPLGASRAMWREYVAMAMNERMKLFDTESVRSVCEEIGQWEAIARFEDRLAKAPHALYYVRRIYNKVGKDPKKQMLNASRKVEILATGTVAEMVARLHETAEARSLIVVKDSHHRAYTHIREAGVYPALEGFYVVSPSVTVEKCARTNFDRDWRNLCLKMQLQKQLRQDAADHPEFPEFEMALELIES